ncbi:MAG: transposase [Flavobacteriales bacterium]|nr:transposase [Flavobacteriales bacterium]
MLNSEGDHVESARVRNDERAITKLVNAWIRKWKLDLPQSLCCLEPTGHYSRFAFDRTGRSASAGRLAHPMNIKRGMGIARGKNDEIDAVRIAQYARRFRDQARMFAVRATSKLKQLLMKRRQLVENKGQAEDPTWEREPAHAQRPAQDLQSVGPGASATIDEVAEESGVHDRRGDRRGSSRSAPV